MPVTNAVNDVVIPGPYDYIESADRAAKQVENLTDMMGRLIERLIDKGALDTDEDIIKVLGYPFTGFAPK